MRNDILTFALDGQVTIETLAKSLAELRTIVTGLTREVEPAADVDWIVEDLRGGSMAVEMRGSPRDRSDLANVEAVSDAWLALGRQMANGHELSYAPAVVRSCRKLRDIASRGDNRMTFGNTLDDVVIRPDAQMPTPAPRKSYGSVTGRIQTISRRRSLKFTLYQLHTDFAVHCYLSADQHELIREQWGQVACVQGMLTRDTDSGRPLSIRQITNIEAMPDVPVRRFEDARGAIEWSPAHPSPEELIRAMRDGE